MLCSDSNTYLSTICSASDFATHTTRNLKSMSIDLLGNGKYTGEKHYLWKKEGIHSTKSNVLHCYVGSLCSHTLAFCIFTSSKCSHRFVSKVSGDSWQHLPQLKINIPLKIALRCKSEMFPQRWLMLMYFGTKVQSHVCWCDAPK